MVSVGGAGFNMSSPYMVNVQHVLAVYGKCETKETFWCVFVNITKKKFSVIEIKRHINC